MFIVFAAMFLSLCKDHYVITLLSLYDLNIILWFTLKNVKKILRRLNTFFYCDAGISNK